MSFDPGVAHHESAAKAWDALSRYKFWMFGYHAGDCVKLNRRHQLGLRNPFRVLVRVARVIVTRGDRALIQIDALLDNIELSSSS